MTNSPSSDSQHPVSEPVSPKAKTRQKHRRNPLACDWCHATHAKCDRAFPCSECLQKHKRCEFTRTRRKRGRVPKPDPFERTMGGDAGETEGLPGTGTIFLREEQSTASSAVSSVQTPEDVLQNGFPALDFTLLNSGLENLQSSDGISWPALDFGLIDSCEELPLPSPLILCDEPSVSGWNHDLNLLDQPTIATPEYDAHTFSRLAAGSSASIYHASADICLKYPVLHPLMPFIEAKISPALACDLLDLYFASNFPTHMHPLCNNIPCWMSRKAAFLAQQGYRFASPALLASMLWVAALDNHVLSQRIRSSDREEICDFLGSLTFALVKPSFSCPRGNLDGSSVHEVEFSSATFGYSLDLGSDDSARGPDRPIRSIDEIIAYIHIASIMTLKGQMEIAIRWWQQGFSLARELQLNREMEAPTGIGVQDILSYTGSCFNSPKTSSRFLDCECYRTHDASYRVTEEQREERRRVWWLLYMVDRHLGISFNRPLALQDSECEGLLLPLDEESWQAGEIHSNSFSFRGPRCPLAGYDTLRSDFPHFTSQDYSGFGLSLPLMTIIGRVIDLYHSQKHLQPDSLFHNEERWASQVQEVVRKLKEYQRNFDAALACSFDLRASCPATDSTETATRLWLARTVNSYIAYYLDFLRLLLSIEENPISRMGDESFWNASSHATCTPHILKAAESLQQTLKLDPDMSFMPSLFNPLLLRSGLHFLHVLEHLQTKADGAVLAACGIMIQATESCFVTSNAWYLKDLSQFLRSALAQARGRPVHPDEARQRRRAGLMLYKWALQEP